ncbi:bifunctional phosphopantothenoylcysteine decarboxylase/phosphopantothenate--cysteine ligase CoaBC [Leucobacter alluvii]|uniref:Coenzyme A biosynthesis bifunctional protein CoaBC n=1 Tax=Leucobacter alluvii TaxID=340321 RepID=A0ABP5MVL2_9MICO
MNIVLGVTGGIAAYKVVQLARTLVEDGHDVHVVPTAEALRFVGKPTWEAISRNPVTTSVHDDVPEVRHVGLGQRADLIVVAPATANTLARMSAGLADDLLGTTLLATRAPVLVAPAMHTEMWQHPATQDNVAILRSRGVHFVGPESGRLTGADTGPGRMSEPETIAERVRALLESEEPETAQGHPGQEVRPVDETRRAEDAAAGDVPLETAAAEALDSVRADTGGAAREPDLAGLRILVTAGGTREPIDPVRYLGNRSSGRQGVAIAAAAADRGAKVVLFAANIDSAVLSEVQDRAAVRVVPVGTAAELERAARAAAAGAEVIIMAAAVADYRVEDVAEQKIRKEDSAGAVPVLQLVENPDILVGLVHQRRPGQVIVGFAAETVEHEDELVERGRRKLARKGADLLAVNAVSWSEGFEAGENTLHVLSSDGRPATVTSGTKRVVADALLDVVRETLDS